jgi:S-formylglutathione hydrolase FrmB
VLPLLAALALLPGFRPALTGPDGGAVLAGTFPGGERPGYVYLPPAFSTARRYPVVYLLHGMRGSPSEFLYGTQLLSFADRGIADGSLKPFVAVMPAAGPNRDYNGEWAGPWERYLVGDVVRWVDAHLPTIRGPSGRILAGLSAGGFGAADIGLRNPGVFGTIESWGGYFHPLRDGPFKHAGRATLQANDPTLVARSSRAVRAQSFFLSSGPGHSHWFTPAETFAFARELRGLGARVTTDWHPQKQGEWRAQLADGLTWALRDPAAPAASRSAAISAGP